MKTSHIMHIIIVALLLHFPAIYAQQNNISKIEQIKNSQKRPEKFWTRTKMIFAGIAGAVAIVFTGSMVHYAGSKQKALKALQDKLDVYTKENGKKVPFAQFPFRIEKGIDTPNYAGETALQYAVYRELASDLIGQMIDLGADITKVNPFTHRTPLQDSEQIIKDLTADMQSDKPMYPVDETKRDIANMQEIQRLLQEALAKKNN